ncbi:MAG: hypothetical protein PHS54_02845 [Clostridia bacterium]|nr:hypothetical protein [Clostridia bacterium]
MNYFETLHPNTKEYFKILSPEFPDFLLDYIETREMQRINEISMSCGMDYTNLYHTTYFYSNLDHSIGVALIVWNFTKDKKQTLAGLFHDIATPAFKHCVDWLNGDSEKQESTEEHTYKMINESKEIMTLLKRDGISIEEVADYKIYPIADNDTPQLSADRLEYTLSTGFIQKDVWKLDEIRKVYNDLIILKNESGIEELGFKNIEIGEFFVKKASNLWPTWIDNKDKMMMEFYAEIFRQMGKYNLLSQQDLYKMSDKEVINRIENCGIEKIERAFKRFRNATYVLESEEKIENKYCRMLKGKIRYIKPLVLKDNKVTRIDEISTIAKKKIEEYLNFKTSKYVALDFELGN